MKVTNGMRVIASEAIGYDGDLNDVPQYAIDAVITAKAIYANKYGKEPNLNYCFVEIQDITKAVLERRGQFEPEELEEEGEAERLETLYWKAEQLKEERYRESRKD